MINFFAPVNFLGIGVHSFNLMKALDSMGEKIAVFPPFGNVNRQGEEINRWLLAREEFNQNDPSVMIFDTQFFPHFSGKPRIGFTTFETDGFTPLQLSALRSCDAILTPSKWGQRILKNYDIASHVVHEGYDPELYEVFNPTDEQRQGRKFSFLHVGKLEERKGTSQLIKAFFLALESEDAQLVLHTHNQFMEDGGYRVIVDEIYKMGFKSMAAPVSHQMPNRFRYAGLEIVITHPTDTISHLYYEADCAVFPTKGEAWGLPIIEAIACGVPTIVGNWSGQSEFLGDDYPKELSLTNYSLVKAVDAVWYYGDRGNWYVPETRELVDKIRWAHENARAFRKTSDWQNKVAQVREFTWERAAVDFLDALNLIRAR